MPVEQVLDGRSDVGQNRGASCPLQGRDSRAQGVHHGLITQARQCRAVKEGWPLKKDQEGHQVKRTQERVLPQRRGPHYVTRQPRCHEKNEYPEGDGCQNDKCLDGAKSVPQVDRGAAARA